MGHYGELWGIMGNDGELWGMMGFYGVSWGIMGNCEVLWRIMGNYGEISGCVCSASREDMHSPFPIIPIKPHYSP